MCKVIKNCSGKGYTFYDVVYNGQLLFRGQGNAGKVRAGEMCEQFNNKYFNS